MHSSQRIKLVKELQQQGITDEALLQAIARIPRERFLDEALAHQAYQQQALPIGFNQTLSQPYIVAKMTGLLALSPAHRVLEIGTGSGYQTAILAQLAQHVWTIERIKSLQWQAKRRFKQLDLHNISSKHGDGGQGWITHAPFDAILVTAAAQSAPAALLQQLAEGGCLVIPIGKTEQYLYKIVRQGDDFHQQRIEKVYFVPLIQGELQ